MSYDSITSDPEVGSSCWDSSSSILELNNIKICVVHDDGPQEDCFICMDEFEEESETVSLRRSCECNCVVRVHMNCLNDWFEHRLECPICHRQHPIVEDAVQMDDVVLEIARMQRRREIQRRRHELKFYRCCIIILVLNIILILVCGIGAGIDMDNSVTYLQAYLAILIIGNFFYFTIASIILQN